MQNATDTSRLKSLKRTNKSQTQQLLRYHPALLRKLNTLLTTVTAYLPKQLAQHLLEIPNTDILTFPLNGTAMFADIDGFTAMTERFSQMASQEGAEEVTELVNRFLAILINTTTRYGGDLQKFGGDAGLLLFTGKEHALRAVAAALDVQHAVGEQMGEVETSLGRFPFRIAIGLGSGTVIAAGIGSAAGKEWLLTGEALQTMCTAQGAAPGGGVVLGKATYLACKQHIQAQPLNDSFYILDFGQSNDDQCSVQIATCQKAGTVPKMGYAHTKPSFSTVPVHSIPEL